AVPHMHPGEILINDYTYTLPDERIARYPLPERDASKLLVYQNEVIIDDSYRHIDRYLPAGSLLVFNNTKVVEARLLFQKPSGGQIELFCLEPHENYGDISTGLLQQEKVWWKCLIGGASKWKAGQVLHKSIEANGQPISLEARYIEKQPDCFVIEFSWTPGQLPFADILHHAGLLPLPPYLKRPADADDRQRYQTVYAAHDGSVAAPTAGLHFTPALFDRLRQKDIHPAFITLHVGAGTFKPVKSAAIGDHLMHSELIDVSAAFIRQLIDAGSHVFAVGTTSLRTLESLYWMGVKTTLDTLLPPASLPLTQWEVYEPRLNIDLPVKDALESLLQWMERNAMERLLTKTQVLIAPGYRLRMIRGLITNFHQPQSTLLLLVAAVAGPDWKTLYDHALQHDYRFLSYGDGCLLYVEDF
ncbi:MAG TPA: S-adenosylmethionine:tRNA ribosyltransferase-isomerase, partial [Chitinophagaceae bacterium]|nr:S-adenosylmethionine:tRNA ribosyltransferase-isomerase [Chitinophagaceae bacterium]